MNALISTRPRRLCWTLLAFVVAFGVALWISWRADASATQSMTDGEIMKRFIAFPVLLAVAALALLSACASAPRFALANAAAPASAPAKPFMAQVVGLQWLNPLQRRDYPTEWQLLWTLGLAQPNKDDDMVKTNPKKYSKLQSIGIIAMSSETETFEGFHEKYIQKLTYILHDIYFSDARYFYNVHSSKDKTNWRELAGIHVEYALPAGKLDPVDATSFMRKELVQTFDIGNIHFPTLWTRNIPPDVRVTMGGPNAGFTSLAAALDYLQAHPNETA